MSIKVRLLLSYIAMTCVPVILFALIAHALSGGPPAFWETSRQRDELAAGVKFVARTDPARFSDNNFVKTTDQALHQFQAGLVVVRDGRISYVSALVASPDLEYQLQALPTPPAQPGWAQKVNNRFSVEQYPISFSDQSQGTVYVLSDLNILFDAARKFVPLLVVALFLVIGLTNGILTLLVSRSLIKPLYALKHAAEQITEGNLEHAVQLNRKDEIGQLGAAFEAMRGRLNESIRLQLQYEENRKELIANISHDLKTPITGIKACVEGIGDGIADTGPKRQKYVNMIARKADEMDRLIDELLLFSKLDLKRLPFHLESVDLAAYLSDCVAELRLDPRMDGIPITLINSHDGPVTVTADREKLGRVIMNIVDNSLKYMNKEQKQIQVALLDGKAAATVHISDNGPGIDSAALPQIFDRFYRAEPSRNRATGGSGLGLAIVKQIVEGHGGRVWAESRPGEGTSIYFTLPKQPGGEQS